MRSTNIEYFFFFLHNHHKLTINDSIFKLRQLNGSKSNYNPLVIIKWVEGKFFLRARGRKKEREGERGRCFKE